MTFDADLVLADGSAVWSHVNLVTSDQFGTPTSVTRNDGGFVVIDLGSAGIGAAISGLAAVLILPAANHGLDELTATIEESTAVGFGSGTVKQLTEFSIAAASKGIILGSECPATVVKRISPTLRYLRCYAFTTNVSDDFGLVQCLLTPYPYKRL